MKNTCPFCFKKYEYDSAPLIQIGENRDGSSVDAVMCPECGEVVDCPRDYCDHGSVNDGKCEICGAHLPQSDAQNYRLQL